MLVAVNFPGQNLKMGRLTMSDQELVAESFRGRAGAGDSSATRREFFIRLPGAAALTAAVSAVPLGSSAKADGTDSVGTQRALDSYQIREEAARAESNAPIPKQVTNGDEQNPRLKFIGNYSKGLPHPNKIGEVDRNAYFWFLNAVRQGTSSAFENVPLGGNTKLVNPLAGVAFDLEGKDSHQLMIPAFPSVTSQELVDQAVELYWQALCRDVNFTEYGSNTMAIHATQELSKLLGFKGPRIPRGNGSVTSQALFRGFTAGDVTGPYVSQLLLSPINYGPYFMNGKMSMYVPGIDYMTDQISWLKVQNGQGPFAQNTIDPTPRYIRNGRDYAMYVHSDPLGGLFMSFYNA